MTTGRAYSFTDADVIRGRLYYYRLEDIDIHGQKTVHGPVCVDWDGDGDGIIDGEETWKLEGREGEGSRILGRGGGEVLSEDADGVILELRTAGFEAENVTADDGRTFERLRIDDYIHGYTNEIGRPQLPAKGILLNVPPGKAAQISVLETEVQIHSGHRPKTPALRPIRFWPP